MTTNQIRYWELQEKRRSNAAQEQETARSNRAKEGISSAANVESMRHNVASEAQAASDLLERSRSNQANEAIARVNAALTKERNDEQKRSNLANEVIGRSNAAASNMQAKYRQIAASNSTVDTITRQKQLEETTRSNKAKEDIERERITAQTASGILSTLGGLGQTLLRKGGK